MCTEVGCLLLTSSAALFPLNDPSLAEKMDGCSWYFLETKEISRAFAYETIRARLASPACVFQATPVSKRLHLILRQGPVNVQPASPGLGCSAAVGAAV